MQKQQINQGWFFARWDAQDAAVPVELPHDAMLLEPRDPALENGPAVAFYPGGKYVYTKILRPTAGDAAQTLILEFEGVYMDSHVLLNGEEIGGRFYGYSNFFVDLTGKLKPGEANELRVVVDNSHQPNSRWYSGSGIYRSVNLWRGGAPAYLPPEGLRVRTVSLDPAVVEVEADLSHAAGYTLGLEIWDGGTLAARGEGSPARLTLPDPKPWSAARPHLYTLRATLTQGETVCDTAQTRFGLRTLAWSAARGLEVNGETVKLRGGCIHHDHGILGAAAYDKAELRRVKKLKALGYNAIRCAHNPAGKNLLDICDELGMYVMEEAFDQWQVPQTACDYALRFDEEWKKDLASLVSKDYNHPCVILYSVGNEITDVSLPTGGAICRQLCAYVKQLDPARPVTLAVNTFLAALVAEQTKQGAKDLFGSQQVNEIVTLIPKLIASSTPESVEAIIGECAEAVDIMGYNYSHWLYEGTHALKPERVIVSSETYPHDMAANWASAEQHPYVIGDFHWTAWDYLGEAGVGLPVYGSTQAPFSKDYPCRTAACGNVDLTGFPEAAAYYTAILWGAYDQPYLCVRPVNHSGEPYTLGKWRLTDAIPCWTWPGCEGHTAEVEVYGRGSAVELSLNGVTVGRKELADCRAAFTLPYQPGVLKAALLDAGGRVTAETTLATAQGARQLAVLPEDTQARPGELVFVPVHLTDTAGTLCMTEDTEVQVTVEGGRLLALGSGRPETEQSYQDTHFKTWHGRVLAVVQAGPAGTLTVRAACAAAPEAAASIPVR